MHYILENNEIKEVPINEWAIWFETADRQIEYDDISDLPNYPDGDCLSTVFVGIDSLGAYFKKPPRPLETMIFGGEYHNKMWRHSSIEEAKNCHKRILECLKNGEPPE